MTVRYHVLTLRAVADTGHRGRGSEPEELELGGPGAGSLPQPSGLKFSALLGSELCRGPALPAQ